MDTQKKTSPETTSEKKVDYTRWGKTVRISNETYDFIQKHGKFGETFDEVIRKLLKVAE
jgi:hypothetical protein